MPFLSVFHAIFFSGGNNECMPIFRKSEILLTKTIAKIRIMLKLTQFFRRHERAGSVRDSDATNEVCLRLGLLPDPASVDDDAGDDLSDSRSIL